MDNAEMACNIQDAYLLCAKLSGAVALADALSLISSEGSSYWYELIECHFCDLKRSLFAPNPEEGHTS